MATRRTWASIQRHANEAPDLVALSGQGWEITYGELVARTHSLAEGPSLQRLSFVAADRSGQAVVDVLAAQDRSHPALVLPETPAPVYVRSAREAIRAAGDDDPLLSSLRGGILTTTSGSTGAPKIVVHDPVGIDRFIECAQECFGLGRTTVSLSLSPVNFDVALLDVWAVLAVGGRVHFAGRDRLTDGTALGRMIDTQAVTFIQAVPALLTLIAGGGVTHETTRLVISTGDFFPAQQLQPLKATFPNAVLLSVYGSTETNDTFACDLTQAANGVLGNPLPGVEYVLDHGELVVYSPYQALGYIGAPNDPWIERSNRRWFRTGDGAEQSVDGCLCLRGRIDRVRKIRGQRISLDDVEASLRSHPSVEDAIAIDAGEAPVRVEAIVRMVPGSTVTSLALRTHLAQRLIAAAIPSRIWVTDSLFSKTNTGKTDRRATYRHLTEGDTH